MEGKVLEHTLGQGAESGQDLTRQVHAGSCNLAVTPDWL